MVAWILHRGCSLVGRAPPLHGGGPGFDSPQLHRRTLPSEDAADDRVGRPGSSELTATTVSCAWSCDAGSPGWVPVAGRRARDGCGCSTKRNDTRWNDEHRSGPRQRDGRNPHGRHTVDALAPAAEEGRGHATIRLGERRARDDPRMSEWGNPAEVDLRHPWLNT